MNKVILVGNLTKDPEIRVTPGGASVCKFTVAVQRRYQKDGQRQADFINCIAWRGTADFVHRYFQKGQSIQLCGSIQTRSWDGQDGQKHYATEVIADEVEFNGGRKTETEGEWRNVPPENVAAFFGADNEDDLPF